VPEITFILGITLNNDEDTDTCFKRNFNRPLVLLSGSIKGYGFRDRVNFNILIFLKSALVQT